jgi:hypothetical protein
MADRLISGRTVKLILRVASCVISVYAAVIIFAVSLAFYAGALASWAQGNLDRLTLLLGVFLSSSAIGIVVIQTNAESGTKHSRLIGGVLGGMGSLTLAYFSVYFFSPVLQHLDASAAVTAAFFALSTFVTVLRTYYALSVALR